MSLLRHIVQCRGGLPRGAPRIYLSQTQQASASSASSLPPSSSQGSQGNNVGPFTDPYPLPLSPSTLDASASIELDPFPRPIVRPIESTERMRARLTYQSRKRGILEADLLLSTFAGEHLNQMSLEELREFDRLLDEPDWDIYYWAVGMREPPQRWADSPLLELLQYHAANEGKVIRRMPDLSALLG